MARMRQWIGLAAIGLLLTGCVPQEKYAALKLDDDREREQLGQSQSETQQAQAEAAAYKAQLAQLNNAGAHQRGSGWHPSAAEHQSAIATR